MATLVRQLLSLDPFMSKPCPVLTNAADFYSVDNMHVYGQISACGHVSRTECNVYQPGVELVGFPNHYGTGGPVVQ
ncbi:hypothetical protein KOW79_015965 [Hemibagrus wyckioides]|uniref:Uncharacterized protein n=1 Tax=Hemibagrus wyckioides TaxID=337641 RepID=A0A9D3NDB7_9TELE|nr:hypothetical protein KOW79_015965 [Hemibagrus wyckioides]